FIGGDPNPYGPEIELKGAGPGNGASIAISRASHVAVKGLCINGFDASVIGIAGAQPESGDVTEDIEVTGCYLGIDPTGTECGRQSGTCLSAARVRGLRIGGDDLQERNILSCARSTFISLGYCGDVEIVNNIIGTDRTGTADLFSAPLGGVHLSHTVGPVLFRDNQVCNAYWELVNISHTECDNGQVTVSDNRLGEGLDGYPMGADEGVLIGYSPGHLIDENIIAHSHGGPGIYLIGDITDYVTISRNSIYECRGGIDLLNPGVENFHGVDFVDGVYGPGVNEEIDTPLCESMNTDTESTTVYFRCMRDCVVEIFIADPSVRGVCSEAGYDYVYSGMTYLGDAEEIVQGPVWSTYRYTMTPALAPGTRVTCTATNGNGSTSEFGCTCEVPLAGEIAEGCIPEGYAFEAFAPNQGRDGIDLRYRIPEPALVQIRVYDLAGHQVAVITGGPEQAGEHTVLWKPRLENGGDLPNGTYLVRLTADQFVATREVVIVR
ncbi:T9SS type A sorting domain-containing protein, partial [Candidatus Fermentibacteria bacterium]|nr:T9SS type A sorting domain-containing protein [Candidatus Fermentibacteria bacterium]